MEVPLKVENICRICLKEELPLEDIYAALGDDRISFANMISLVAYIPVQNSDGMPFQICVECISSLEFAYNFRNKIVESFQLLIRHKTEVVAVKEQKPIEDMDDSDTFADDSPDQPVKVETPEKVEIKVKPKKTTVKPKKVIDKPKKIKVKPKKIKVKTSAFKLAKDQKRLAKNQCPLCLELLSADAFSDHVRSHYELSQLDPPKKGDKSTCTLCNKNFRKHCELYLHHRGHLNINPYKCEFCDKSFTRKETLANHVDEHDGVKRHQCKTCGKVYGLRSSLSIHEQNHLTEVVRCSVCGKSYKNKYKLKVHMKQLHDEAKFKCEHAGCDRAFTNVSLLKRHITRTHVRVKPYACSKCGKTWFTRTELEAHEVSHSLVMKFQCDECFKLFPRKRSLELHILRHSDKKPFVCEYCSFGFVDKYKYRQHQEKSCKMKKMFG